MALAAAVEVNNSLLNLDLSRNGLNDVAKGAVREAKQRSEDSPMPSAGGVHAVLLLNEAQDLRVPRLRPRASREQDSENLRAPIFGYIGNSYQNTLQVSY